MIPLTAKDRLYRLWELLVIRFVLITGKGKRRREWIHYRRSMGARKGAATKKAMKAARVSAAEGNQAGSGVSDSFTPPGQSEPCTLCSGKGIILGAPCAKCEGSGTAEPYVDHESDAVQPA